MILRHHKKPEMFSSIMCSFFVNLMPNVVFLWAIFSFYYFFEMSHHLDVKIVNDLETSYGLITKNSILVLQIALIITILIVILPIRSI